MYPLIEVKYDGGNTIYIENNNTFLAKTYSARDYAGSGLFVYNVSDFSANTHILLGAYGQENSEIVTATGIDQANNIINTGTLKLYHRKGESVTHVLYDQVEIQKASSLGGTYTTLATVNIFCSDVSTIYAHSAGLATDYYRARFKSSITGNFTPWSSETTPVIKANSLANLVNSVRSSIGNTNLGDDFFVQAINDARDVLENTFGYGRIYEWRQKFDYPIKMLAGTNFVNLPTTGANAIQSGNTNRYILAARYGRQGISMNQPMRYIDKQSWNSIGFLNRYTTLAANVTSGATSIVLENSGDFFPTGTIFIATEDPTQSVIQATYTANNLNTNTLSGVTNLNRNISAGTQVWLITPPSYPMHYTVFDNKIYFDRAIPQVLQGKNLYIDYYKKLIPISNMSDELPEPYYSIYAHYLRYAVKRRRDDSITQDDIDFKNFITAAKNVFGNAYTGQTVRIRN